MIIIMLLTNLLKDLTINIGIYNSLIIFKQVYLPKYVLQRHLGQETLNKLGQLLLDLKIF